MDAVVIPLFSRTLARTLSNEASTHFQLEHPAAGGTLRTLCGREGVSVLLKPAKPACEACVAEWQRLSGWAFPLPDVVCTA
jgi:hypothetical protein